MPTKNAKIQNDSKQIPINEMTLYKMSANKMTIKITVNKYQ
jgi:hypothetical protein